MTEAQNPSPLDILTPRQRDVAELIAQGLAKNEIAKQLSLSRSAVKSCVEKVYTALGVNSRTQLGSLTVDPDCLKDMDFSNLTARQREVLDLAGSGLTNEQTARQLGLRSPNVVRAHQSDARKKLGLDNIVQFTKVGKALNEKTRDSALAIQSDVLDNLARFERDGSISTISQSPPIVRTYELIKADDAVQALLDPHTTEVAKEIVDQEVRLFLM